MQLTDTDKLIINQLQGGFPVHEQPWKIVSDQLNIDENTLIDRIQQMIDAGIISRFGPLYNAHKMGGGLTLAALQADDNRFNEIADIVNSFDEVAHNYRRDHKLNMWFVIATQRPEQIEKVIEKIEELSQCTVYNMPKQAEYFLGLKLEL